MFYFLKLCHVVIQFGLTFVFTICNNVFLRWNKDKCQHILSVLYRNKTHHWLAFANLICILDWQNLRIYAKLWPPLLSICIPTKSSLILEGFKLILTTIKYTDIYRWSIWRINNISIFAKFILCHFIYSILVVSWIWNLLIYQIRRKMKCLFVSCPDDCFDIFMSRSNNIYSSIILLTETWVVSCIQCYNQCCVIWNCFWHNNIDSCAS